VCMCVCVCMTVLHEQVLKKYVSVYTHTHTLTHTRTHMRTRILCTLQMCVRVCMRVCVTSVGTRKSLHVYEYGDSCHTHDEACHNPPKNGLIALQTPRTSRFPIFYYCQVVNRTLLRLLSTYVLV